MLASFPVGWFTGNSASGVNRLFRVLRLFKLFRMLRLLKLFPRLFQLLETSIKFNPSMIRFLRSFIIMVMMWHWIACMSVHARRDGLRLVPTTRLTSPAVWLLVSRCCPQLLVHRAVRVQRRGSVHGAGRDPADIVLREPLPVRHHQRVGFHCAAQYGPKLV